eukprot:gene10799-12002_t
MSLLPLVMTLTGRYRGRRAGPSYFYSSSFDPQTIVNEGQKFFEACLKPVRNIQFSDLGSNNHRDKDRISCFIHRNSVTAKPNLAAYFLPSTLTSWPSFSMTKSKNVDCPEVLFQRLGDMSEHRVDAILKHLQEGQSTACIGSPGVGKSAEMSFILMKLLQTMHCGWPKEVLFRTPDYALTFRWQSHSGPVVEHRKDTSLLSIQRDYQALRNSVVALIELDQQETNLVMDVPSHTTLSLDRIAAESQLNREHQPINFLYEAPSLDRLSAMAIIYSNLPNTIHMKGLSPQEAEELVNYRAKRVGCLPSIVLGDYQTYLRHLESIFCYLPSIGEELLNLNQLNISPIMQLYISLVLQPSTEATQQDADNQTNVRFRPFQFCLLSEYLSTLLLMALWKGSSMEERHIQALHRHGLHGKVIAILSQGEHETVQCALADFQQWQSDMNSEQKRL